MFKPGLFCPRKPQDTIYDMFFNTMHLAFFLRLPIYVHIRTLYMYMFPCLNIIFIDNI